MIMIALAGCGDDNEGVVTSPPAAEVIGELPIVWERLEAFGGQAQSLLYHENDLFAVHDKSVWRFDVIAEEWSKTAAQGSRLVATDDGYLFTDWGWRLVPGDMEWTVIDAEVISVGSNGRTIFGFGTDRTKPLRSDDYGETWTELPATPGDAIAVAEAEGNVYVSLTDPYEGVWRLDEGGLSWQATSLERLVSAFHVTSDGDILAERSHDLYWSETGDVWNQIQVIGEEFSSYKYVGGDEDGRPLIAVNDTVHVLTPSGELTPLTTFPGHQPIRAFAFGNTNVRYISDDTGIWRFAGDADVPALEQIGMPGDFLRKVFHLPSGMYGAFAHGAGSANWQRYDEFSGRWSHAGLSSSFVNDVVELHSGRQLLATHSAQEGGYGDAYLLDENHQWVPLITAGPELTAVAVDDDGNWFIATGNAREASEFRALLSADNGATWSDTNLNADVIDLATVCGETYAATSDGLFVYSNGQWRAEASVNVPMIGIHARNNNAAFFSTDRVWYSSNCMEQIEAVALPSGYTIDDIAIDDDGTIWLASGENGIVRQAGETDWLRFDAGLPDGPICISLDEMRTAWVRVRGFGFYVADFVD